MRKNCKIVHEHSERVIRERRKSLDFLDILLTALDEDGNGLTDLEIRN